MSFLVKLTLKQLIYAGIHIGHEKKIYLNKNIVPYLSGYNNLFLIINLYYTNYQLKLVLRLITNLAFARQTFFFTRRDGFGSFKNTLHNVVASALFIYDFPWIHGFLTNFKELKTHWLVKDTNMDDSNRYKLTWHQRANLIQASFLPTLLIYFDNNSFASLDESMYVRVPTVGVMDTNTIYFKLINYFVVSNIESYSALHFQYNLFYNAVITGIEMDSYYFFKKKII